MSDGNLNNSRPNEKASANLLGIKFSGSWNELYETQKQTSAKLKTNTTCNPVYYSFALYSENWDLFPWLMRKALSGWRGGKLFSGKPKWMRNSLLINIISSDLLHIFAFMWKKMLTWIGNFVCFRAVLVEVVRSNLLTSHAGFPLQSSREPSPQLMTFAGSVFRAWQSTSCCRPTHTSKPPSLIEFSQLSTLVVFGGAKLKCQAPKLFPKLVIPPRNAPITASA